MHMHMHAWIHPSCEPTEPVTASRETKLTGGGVKRKGK
jgi:hypothetical protein